MDCAACSLKVTRAVERLPGVSEVKVALMAEKLSLQLDPGGSSSEKIEATVRSLGYQISAPAAATDRTQPAASCCGGHDHKDHAHDKDHDHDTPAASARADAGHGAPGHVHDDPADRGKAWYQTGKGRLVLLTGILLAVAWGAELLFSEQIGYAAFLAACLIGVAPVARRAFAALRLGQPFTIESLMTIAAIGALVIGAAEEAALVVFLFAVGEVLEGVAAGKARQGIRALADLVPKTAWLEEAGQLREVAAASLTPGQILLVRPGDRIAADGEITEGRSGIDESPVTGESLPVSKGEGDQVFAGSINTEAVLRLRVTRPAADNTISRIIRLVEEAEEARAPVERFIDRFSRWYMPAIVLVSALVVLLPPLIFGGDWDTWIYRGLALLLIGCPCALVISVPASVASALSSGAKRGLLLKGGAVIEAAAGVTRIAFDKTGTLTEGRPVVTDLLPAPGVSPGDLLAIAGAVEAGSSHPLARAITARLASDGITAPAASEARAMPGQGVTARVGAAQAQVLSPGYAESTGLLSAGAKEAAAVLEASGKTVVLVSHGSQALGLIAMRDEPRADAAAAMRELGDMGIRNVMLTGDNPRTAAAIAGALGMEFRAGMLPADKLEAIRSLSAEGPVMMIGDGINDAPALKQASLGVAMGSGTDVALETADAAILRDRVRDVPALIRLSRATMANIRQNVTLALGLKVVFLVTSVLGLTGLWIAILADTGATVLVTLNALRLLRYDPSASPR
ncbi:heavy metal translocating P-type ATPase [Pseudogemmobacter faecipullorum]|uniref:P-type Zn(2+) transporter n=1 Tax=Pseudogemmobacter faecipullorum TaxID=2755041 RepID=A0ABS8CHY5_9RHOB|nr:heavy metal translocating P-type ATPase [Pseudogemmobacter faecipullorum]MCB5409006.1 cadmium-translocating P-type ATPase [Pseudogemmobacter faecipullorum]